MKTRLTLVKSLPWLVLLGSVVTLWGWLSNRLEWVVISNTEAPVQFNTAVGFILASIALFLLPKHPRGLVTRAMALLIALLGFVTLCQYVLRLSLGVDELLFQHTVTSQTPFPGRMAPSTAFGFLLVGVALLTQSAMRIAIGWALMLLLSLVLVDRLTGGMTQEVTPFTSMAPQTQGLFSLLSLSFLLTGSQTSEQNDPIDFHLPLFVACSLTLLLATWKLLEQDQWLERHREVGVALETLSGNLEYRLQERGRALWRLSDRWNIYGDLTQEQFQQEMQRYLRDFPNIDVVVVVQPNLIVRWQASRDSDIPLITGTSLGTDQDRLAIFKRALDLKAPQLMPFLDLRIGERGTAYTVPIFEQGRHVGFINASISADSILRGVRGPFFNGFGLALLDEAGRLVSGELPANTDIGALLNQQTTLNVFGRTWQLAVWPNNDYLLRRATWLPLYVLVFGLVTGAVFTILFKAMQRQSIGRQHAQESARVSDERFHYVAQATSDVIWDWDITTVTLWWNEGMNSVFGYVDDPRYGSPEWRASRIHPEDRDAVLTSLQNTLDGDELDWHADYRFLDAQDNYRHVSDRGFVIRNDYGTAIRMVGGIEDTTEQRESANRLIQAQKMDAVGQLTGGVAHDFNNLLTVILGNAEVLSETLADSPQLKRTADMMVVAASRGAELTSRLLAFARRQPLNPALINLADFISGLDTLLRRSVEEHIDIQIRLSDKLIVVEVDEGQLESALLNLVLNARDAMPGGGRLTIETSTSRLDDSYAEQDEEGKAGDYAMISISDTGYGMPDEVMQRAFEPFFTTKPKGRGTGLGLSMVIGFIKQSGGHVKLYSEEGEGTSVKLYLPLASKQPAAAEASLPDLATGGSEQILLVEDDELVRQHVKSLLIQLGYQVSSAASGSEALTLIESQLELDLLFTDVIMPGGINGPELAKRALAIRPNIKVLFTSGYTENAIIHHGRLDEGVQLLSKPYRKQELAAKLREVLTS